MEIADGKYQPQPHIAQELLKFPDELSSQKMIQQFLGLVNYMADFLPKLSNHTVWLFPILKKNPSPWTSRQTEAVKEIKKLAEQMPPLKIPAGSEKRILQTDASDECWGAVFFVQDDKGKRHVCGYKSGTFKASEQHYHSTFKEVLAVKRGIEKFQFHLLGHEFHIEMDMSSFPRMLQFKRKMLPHAQLLRWSNWFSQWKFTVKHIKGTENVLADFLSRPKHYKKECKNPKDAQLIHTTYFPMVFPISLHKENGSSSSSLSSTSQDPILTLPEEIVENIATMTLEKRAHYCYKTFLTILLKKYGLFMKDLKFHPDYPFLNIFHIHDLRRFPKEALCFFYYLFECFTIGISFNATALLTYIIKSQFGDIPPQSRYLLTMLQWFVPHHQWTRWLTTSSCKPYIVVMFRRPSSFLTPSAVCDKGSLIYYSPYCFIHRWYDINPSSVTCANLHKEIWMESRNSMAKANGVDPQTIPFFILGNLQNWTNDNPDSAKWIEATNEWKSNHLEAAVETSDEEYIIWTDDEDEHTFGDPFEDDPTESDARSSP